MAIESKSTLTENPFAPCLVQDGKTPFLVALERGMINVCDYLMTRQGKDILLAKDQFGNSAMHLAGGAGSAEAVKWLLEQDMNEHWIGTNMVSRLAL